MFGKFLEFFRKIPMKYAWKFPKRSLKNMFIISKKFRNIFENYV